jgi:hypothetical protein
MEQHLPLRPSSHAELNLTDDECRLIKDYDPNRAVESLAAYNKWVLLRRYFSDMSRGMSDLDLAAKYPSVDQSKLR